MNILKILPRKGGYMNNSIRDPKQMFEIFFEYFGSGISTEAIILTIYVLFLAVFLKYSFKGIIISVIGITIAYTIYLLVYDITYVQYLISLKLDESLRLLLTQYFPYFSLSESRLCSFQNCNVSVFSVFVLYRRNL